MYKGGETMNFEIVMNYGICRICGKREIIEKSSGVCLSCVAKKIKEGGRR